MKRTPPTAWHGLLGLAVCGAFFLVCSLSMQAACERLQTVQKRVNAARAEGGVGRVKEDNTKLEPARSWGPKDASIDDVVRVAAELVGAAKVVAHFVWVLHVGSPNALRDSLSTVGRDPFLPAMLSVPVPPLPPAMSVPEVKAAAPVVVEPQQAPTPQLQFAGRMTTPDGRVLVLARWGDGAPVSLEEGRVLGNGFRVERVTEQTVDLLNPQTQAMLQLPLPSPPRFELR